MRCFRERGGALSEETMLETSLGTRQRESLKVPTLTQKCHEWEAKGGSASEGVSRVERILQGSEEPHLSWGRLLHRSHTVGETRCFGRPHDAAQRSVYMIFPPPARPPPHPPTLAKNSPVPPCACGLGSAAGPHIHHDKSIIAWGTRVVSLGGARFLEK